MDHMTLSSVVEAANEVTIKEPALHGIVNNAGIMATPYKMSDDGYESQWQTNYLAHWVFTSHLLPLLLSTSKGLPAGSVRVVNLTSGGHMMAPKPGINFGDTSLKDEPSIYRYGQSKLANVLHAKTLHKKYGPGSSGDRAGNGQIWTSSVHPGIVESELDNKAMEAPWYVRLAAGAAQTLGARWPTDKGAWTPVYCVASPTFKAEHSGWYHERIAKAGGLQSAKSKDMDLAAKLEEWTEREMKKKGFA
jgi:NAD(P)-dependent dehydrogenase (short-subunit alcohol dehydrogenase family)